MATEPFETCSELNTTNFQFGFLSALSPPHDISCSPQARESDKELCSSLLIFLLPFGPFLSE